MRHLKMTWKQIRKSIFTFYPTKEKMKIFTDK